MATAADYYLLIDGKEEGPFSLEQLRVMVRNGEIPPTTLAARDGWKDWIEVQHVLNVHGPMVSSFVADLGKRAAEERPPLSWPTLIFMGLFIVAIFVMASDLKWEQLAGYGLLALMSVVSLFVYFIPSFIAWDRKHRNLPALIALNFFLGWTIIGWVMALVWSLYRDKPEKTAA